MLGERGSSHAPPASEQRTIRFEQGMPKLAWTSFRKAVKVVPPGRANFLWTGNFPATSNVTWLRIRAALHHGTLSTTKPRNRTPVQKRGVRGPIKGSNSTAAQQGSAVKSPILIRILICSELPRGDHSDMLLTDVSPSLLAILPEMERQIRSPSHKGVPRLTNCNQGPRSCH